MGDAFALPRRLASSGGRRILFAQGRPMTTANDAPLPRAKVESTPLSWRVIIFAAILLLGSTAYVLEQAGVIGLQTRSAFGFAVFIGLALGCSGNLRSVNWRTVAWGI